MIYVSLVAEKIVVLSSADEGVLAPLFACSAVNSIITGSSVGDVVLCFAPRTFFSCFYVGDAGNTPLVDAGTALGATTVVPQGVLVVCFGSAAS